ncbi:MAG: cation:proton antiporter [Clostridia bacterium]|nr:cation:proton antiporter [Clostridia bacterium]
MSFIEGIFNGDYGYLAVLAVILLSTKFLGLASRKVHMPAVVGALLAGIILGPSCLGVVHQTDFLTKTAEIGVIILMFLSGLETDLNELKENGIASFIVALIGVIIPLGGGTLIYYIMNPEGEVTVDFLKALFVGVTLTATSVSITVETLRELGKLSGRMGTTILGAAVIDDIIGIVVLTAITSMSGEGSSSIWIVLLKIILFFIFVLAAAGAVFTVKKLLKGVKMRRRISIYVLAFCFIMSFCSEEFFGVADITGAYFAGIILCTFGSKGYIDQRFDILGYLFFSPIFFASIGLKTNLGELVENPSIISFAIVLLIVAVLSKVIGCGIGAKLCKFSNKDALSIGIGMVSRGEVALIVAQKGSDCGLLNSNMFPAIVFMVIVTTLITPVMLKLILTEKQKI